jgi:hypothetical protein
MRAHHILVAAGLSLAALAPAAAQSSDEPPGVRKRNNCRLAGQVLEAGHPHPRYEWARRVIVNCEDEGPSYFSTRWAAAPDDTTALRQMIAGSTRIRDARLYSRLRQVAADRSRPDAARVAAMIALANYVDPAISIDLSELRPPQGHITRVRYRGGTSLHAVQVPGTQPLGLVTAEVLALLNGIAADRSAETRDVWYAAAVLSRRIEMDAAARGQ